MKLFKLRLVSQMLLGFFMVVSGAVFVGTPRLEEKSDSLVITFAVSAPTDVEVGIVDGSGKVIRHLAAGVLGGEKEPPAPLLPGLSQRLTWDGLDDYGRLSYSGPFKARVRAGVSPVFDRSITVKVFPDSWGVLYGADTVIDTSELIPMTHPVWREAMGSTRFPDTFPDGSKKFAMYAQTTRLDMAVSDETDEIVIQGWKGNKLALLDGITGSLKTLWPDRPSFPMPADGLCTKNYYGYGEPAMDWFGRFVVNDEGGGCNYIFRFNLNGTPLPFASGTHVFTQLPHSGGDYRQRGLTVGPDGSIYSGHYPLLSDTVNDNTGLLMVSKHDSTGRVLNERLVRVYGNIGQGVRVDLKGNLFLGVKAKPLGQAVPSALRSKLAGDSLDKYSQWYWADEMYGSIVKFGPEGGSILPDASGDLLGGPYNKRARATGMQWMHYGASFQANHVSYRAQSCWCYTPRFDVDRFGRVLFPNPFENEVKALDNNGNLIFRVHNRNLYGKVRVGLAHGVQVTDRGIYLADHTNNQIVRLAWRADAEALLSIQTLGMAGWVRSPRLLAISSKPNPSHNQVMVCVNGLQEGEGRSAGISLAIHDASGRKVMDLSPALRTGKTEIAWNGTDFSGRSLPSGIYYCRLSIAGRSLSRALTLMK